MIFSILFEEFAQTVMQLGSGAPRRRRLAAGRFKRASALREATIYKYERADEDAGKTCEEYADQRRDFVQ